jgi:hypothetical protein
MFKRCCGKCCPNGCCGFCKPSPQVQQQVDNKIHLGKASKENKEASYGSIDIYPGKKNLRKVYLSFENTIKKFFYEHLYNRTLR